MEARIEALEAELHNIRAQMLTEDQAVLIINSRINIINSIEASMMKMASMIPEKDPGKSFVDSMRIKEADKNKPKTFSNNSNDMQFREYIHDVHVWANIIYADSARWLTQAEMERGVLDEDDFLLNIDDPYIVDFSKHLYDLLSHTTGGAAKNVLMTVPTKQGFRAWNELIKQFDPRTNANEVTSRLKLQAPGKRAQHEVQFKDMLRTWEQEVAKHELKFGRLDEMTKVVAVTSMLPASMHDATRAANAEFLTYADMKKYLDSYMNSGPVKLEKLNPDPMQISGFDVPWNNYDWGYASTAEGTMTTDAPVMYMGKGWGYSQSGKVGSKGGWQSEGKGSKGGWQQGGGPYGPSAAKGWHPGKGDGGYWKGGGYGQAKAEVDKGKGKGKGKGKMSDGKCFRCGGHGHIARNCPTPAGKGLQNLDEGCEDYMAQSIKEESEKGDCEKASPGIEGLWCMGYPEEYMGWMKITGKKAAKKTLFNIDEKANLNSNNRFEALQEEIKSEENEELSDIDVIERKGDWVKMEITVDSGAGDSVLPVGLFPEVKAVQNKQSKAGKCFYNASGGQVKNHGEKVIQFYTPAGHKRFVKWQVADVIKPLLSLGRLEDAGCEIIVNKNRRYILDPISKERIPMVKTNGTYKTYLWVKTSECGPVFSRQG